MTTEELKTIKVEEQGKASVLISGEIPFSYLEKHRANTLKKLGENVEIDGFRKGHVPDDKLIQHVGEMAVLGEMAERAIAKAYPLIVKENELDVIGYPQIEITKIAEGNPLGFKATVAVVPTFELPNYKEIAAEINKNKESTEVTDEDVDSQVKDVLRQKVAYERLQEKAAAKAEADKVNAEGREGALGQEKKEDMGGATELPTPESEKAKASTNDDGEEHVHDENCNHDHEEDEGEIELPELTDEYVKTIGKPGQFESVEDFKNKIREHIAIEKEQSVTGAHRAKITDAIVEKTKIELPQVLVDAEINQMSAQMEEDLKRAQLSMDDYLGHIKKTKEELQAEWKPSAEKRASLQLVLNKIAEEEKIELDKGKVDQEVSNLLEQYKDADEARVRVYVESIMTNEAIMKMLEGVE